MARVVDKRSKYHTHVEPKLLLIEAWARDGLIMEDIAKNLGIAKSTFFEYIKRYPELSDSLKSKEEADIIVENSLYKRATGYTYEEVTKEAKTDPETGRTIMVETKRVTKEVVPDTTAQIFWLKNRKPKEWRDRQEIDANITGGLTVVFDTGMTDE